MRLNPSIKLGFLAITLSFTAICATLTTSQTTLAAPDAASKTVYQQFQIFSKNAVKSTPSLDQARKYLLNHIDEVGPWQATLMTLQLENLQRSDWLTWIKKCIRNCFKVFSMKPIPA